MKYVKKAVHYWCRDTDSGAYTGGNIGVAVLDTGIVAHPDFDGRIKAFVDLVNHRQGLYDDSGHGTHVTGIMGGSGRMSGGAYSGMAPKADIIVLKILDRGGEGSLPAIIKGVKWILQNKVRYNIRVANISVGAKLDLNEEKSRALIQTVDILWDAGIVVVVSAGNYGPEEGTIAAPGTSKKIITVGSSDLPVPPGKSRPYYSGCGPTGECVMKPDVMAPGYSITSCSSLVHKRGNDAYAIKSGSSMSTPVVSGAIALLLSKYPDMNNVEIKLKLRECCDPLKVSPYFQGWGQINVEKLMAD